MTRSTEEEKTLTIRVVKSEGMRMTKKDFRRFCTDLLVALGNDRDMWIDSWLDLDLNCRILAEIARAPSSSRVHVAVEDADGCTGGYLPVCGWKERESS